MGVHCPGSPKQSSRLLAHAAAVVLLSGCLDQAPTYEERERIPPFVIVPSVKPDLDKVARLATNQSLQLRVPFRSDDLGERLTAVFALNRSFLGSDDLGPSTFDDETRAAEFTWRPEVEPGCYQLSMVLTHGDNIDQGVAVYDESMAAYLYWWVDLFDPRDGSTAFCPQSDP